MSRGGSRATSLAIDPTGEILVVWQQQHVVQARSATPDGRFGSVLNLASTTGSPLGTSAALAGRGAAIVAWETAGSAPVVAGSTDLHFAPHTASRLPIRGARMSA
jgi:hypothetical protein